MAKTESYKVFGAADIVGYDRTTHEILFCVQAIGDVNSDFTAEIEDLVGGANNYPLAKAVKSFKSSCKATIKEYNPALMEILTGGTKTLHTVSTTGDVTDEANVVGTSLYGSAGFSAVAVVTGDEADQKEGWFMALAASTTTIDIYAYNPQGLARGTSVTIQDDYNKITASPLTIPSTTGAELTCADLGIKFTRGAAARSVTQDDAFIFYVQKPATTAYKLKFGAANTTFDNIGVMITSQLYNGYMMIIHFYNALAVGAAFPLKHKGWAEYEINIEPMYDSTEDAVGEIRVTAL
jgi:hypothetical protein